MRSYIILLRGLGRDPPNVPCSAERSGEGSIMFIEFSVPYNKEEAQLGSILEKLHKRFIIDEILLLEICNLKLKNRQINSYFLPF